MCIILRAGGTLIEGIIIQIFEIKLVNNGREYNYELYFDGQRGIDRRNYNLTGNYIFEIQRDRGIYNGDQAV